MTHRTKKMCAPITFFFGDFLPPSSSLYCIHLYYHILDLSKIKTVYTIAVMKIIATASTLSLLVASASAFAPPRAPLVATTTTAIASSEAAAEDEPINAVPPAAASKEVAFGWTPNASKPCYGLPGALEPLGFFDPLGFSEGQDLNTIKRYREAEVQHGRVAMLATVGYLIAEQTPTLMYSDVSLAPIANHQLAETPTSLWFPLFLIINFAEAWRSINGWVEPDQKLWTLRDKYYPGGIGFDFLEWAPKNDPEAFERMATRELSNGRLAMIGWAGMCAQELATNQPIFS